MQLFVGSAWIVVLEDCLREGADTVLHARRRETEPDGSLLDSRRVEKHARHGTALGYGPGEESHEDPKPGETVAVENGGTPAFSGSGGIGGLSAPVAPARAAFSSSVAAHAYLRHPHELREGARKGPEARVPDLIADLARKEIRSQEQVLGPLQAQGAEKHPGGKSVTRRNVRAKC